MRFLLIDRILEYRKGESAIGSKDVTMSEDFLEDHFPRFPVMPGVLQVEAISQLASWLIFVSNDFKVKGVLSELGVVKFKDFINYDKVEQYKDFSGCRNEEDFVITETGARLLGKPLPKTIEEVEAVRG